MVFSVKQGVNLKDCIKMKPKILYMLLRVIEYCDSQCMDVTVTSLISDRENIPTISSTHDERAFDLRTRNWTSEQAIALEAWANIEFADIGARSKKNEARAAVLELDHIHFQSINE